MQCEGKRVTQPYSYTYSSPYGLNQLIPTVYISLEMYAARTCSLTIYTEAGMYFSFAQQWQLQLVSYTLCMHTWTELQEPI